MNPDLPTAELPACEQTTQNNTGGNKPPPRGSVSSPSSSLKHKNVHQQHQVKQRSVVSWEGEATYDKHPEPNFSPATVLGFPLKLTQLLEPHKQRERAVVSSRASLGVQSGPIRDRAWHCPSQELPTHPYLTLNRVPSGAAPAHWPKMVHLTLSLPSQQPELLLE